MYNLRRDNTRIVSDHNLLQVVTTNIIFLSAFVGTQYSLPDAIKIQSFDQNKVGDYAIGEIDGK